MSSYVLDPFRWLAKKFRGNPTRGCTSAPLAETIPAADLDGPHTYDFGLATREEAIALADKFLLKYGDSYTHNLPGPVQARRLVQMGPNFSQVPKGNGHMTKQNLSRVAKEDATRGSHRTVHVLNPPEPDALAMLASLAGQRNPAKSKRARPAPQAVRVATDFSPEGLIDLMK